MNRRLKVNADIAVEGLVIGGIVPIGGPAQLTVRRLEAIVIDTGSTVVPAADIERGARIVADHWRPRKQHWMRAA